MGLDIGEAAVKAGRVGRFGKPFGAGVLVVTVALASGATAQPLPTTPPETYPTPPATMPPAPVPPTPGPGVAGTPPAAAAIPQAVPGAAPPPAAPAAPAAAGVAPAPGAPASDGPRVLGRSFPSPVAPPAPPEPPDVYVTIIPRPDSKVGGNKIGSGTGRMPNAGGGEVEPALGGGMGGGEAAPSE